MRKAFTDRGLRFTGLSGYTACDLSSSYDILPLYSSSDSSTALEPRSQLLPSLSTHTLPPGKTFPRKYPFAQLEQSRSLPDIGHSSGIVCPETPTHLSRRLQCKQAD